MFVCLLSGVSQVPLFLQTHSRVRRLYSGLAESCGFRTLFQMVELKSTPPQYSHLAGLLDVFKAKLVHYHESLLLLLKRVCRVKCSEHLHFYVCLHILLGMYYSTLVVV